MDTSDIPLSVTSYSVPPILLLIIMFLGFHPTFSRALVTCIDCSGPGCNRPGVCETDGKCFLRRDVNGLLYRGCADNIRWRGLDLSYSGCGWQKYLGWANARVLWCLCSQPFCNNVPVRAFLARNFSAVAETYEPFRSREEAGGTGDVGAGGGAGAGGAGGDAGGRIGDRGTATGGLGTGGEPGRRNGEAGVGNTETGIDRGPIRDRGEGPSNLNVDGPRGSLGELLDTDYDFEELGPIDGEIPDSTYDGDQSEGQGGSRGHNTQPPTLRDETSSDKRKDSLPPTSGDGNSGKPSSLGSGVASDLSPSDGPDKRTSSTSPQGSPGNLDSLSEQGTNSNSSMKDFDTDASTEGSVPNNSSSIKGRTQSDQEGSTQNGTIENINIDTSTNDNPLQKEEAVDQKNGNDESTSDGNLRSSNKTESGVSSVENARNSTLKSDAFINSPGGATTPAGSDVINQRLLEEALGHEAPNQITADETGNKSEERGRGGKELEGLGRKGEGNSEEDGYKWLLNKEGYREEPMEDPDGDLKGGYYGEPLDGGDGDNPFANNGEDLVTNGGLGRPGPQRVVSGEGTLRRPGPRPLSEERVRGPSPGNANSAPTEAPFDTRIRCPANFKAVPHLRSCYHVDREPQTWWAAEKHCNDLHPRSHLVALDKPGEYEYVVLKIAMEPALMNRWQGWWTGGKYDTEIREFVWSISGHVISRLDPKWRPGLVLSPYTGTCVWLVPLAGFRLGNYGCLQPAGAICEVEV